MNLEILKKAIDQFGFENQTEMIKEECLELALALQKLKRNPCDINVDNVIDEIADVSIMIEQANIMFPTDLIQKRIEYKIDRLQKRIGNFNPKKDA